MKKVCSKMVPRILTPEQKETLMNICPDILQNIENKPYFLGNVITFDKSQIFNVLEEFQVTKKKKALKSKSNFKATMITSFDIRETFRTDWVSEGQTVNQAYYNDVLTTLSERVRRKDLKCGRKAHGFFTKTTHCQSRGFWRSATSPCWNIHSTHVT
jgi:hypothetical protein